MNLPLHNGFLGVIEAGLIALLVGILAYALLRWVVRAMDGTTAQALGWACVIAVAVAAGIDAWNLFSLGMMKLESPLSARLALQGIHDPASLGARVVVQVVAALAGVGIGWLLFTGGWRDDVATDSVKSGDCSD
jgi:hypothetical protein